MILLGIRMHSRIAALVSLFGFLLTIPLVYSLGTSREFLNFEFYLYNAVPCSIALGGTFLVFNRKVFLFTILCEICVITATFIGLRFLTLPVFVAPFNLFTILFIWLVKSGILKRNQGFFAIPMEFISTPEFGLSWYQGELYAADYWKSIDGLR
jgi:urea transporter